MSDNKLTLKTKLGYGVGDLGGNLFFTMMGLYLLFFLTDTVGIDPLLAGAALWVGKAWDAVTDPAVGFYSDRTQSKMGRRRPYILWGAITLFFTMIIMFTNPGFAGQTALFIWAALAYCLLNTAYTLINIPYGALQPELTSDYNERTSMTGYRMTFAVVGTFIAAGAVDMIRGVFANPNTGWTATAAITGAIMMITGLITFFTVKEPVKHVIPKEKFSFDTYKSAIRDKIFLKALFPWIFHITGVTIIMAALKYYFVYVYGKESMFTWAFVSLLVSCIVFIPVWVKISKTVSKKRCYNVGMVIFAASVVVFFFVGHHLPKIPSGDIFVFVIMAIAGFGFATQYVMPYAIIPDVVENDYANNGVRREGVFYGLWTFGSKIGAAFAIGLNGLILKVFGYVADQTQDAVSQLGIKLLVGPIPALFFIAGVIVLSFYPIDHGFYKKVLEKIAARNGNSAEGG